MKSKRIHSDGNPDEENPPIDEKLKDDDVQATENKRSLYWYLVRCGIPFFLCLLILGLALALGFGLSGDDDGPCVPNPCEAGLRCVLAGEDGFYYCQLPDRG